MITNFISSTAQELIEFNKLIPWTSKNRDLTTYFNYLLDNKQIVIERDSEDNIIGIVELFKMNFAYLGYYMVVGDRYFLDVHTYNVANPTICFIANFFVLEEYRSKQIIRNMKAKVISITTYADYFVGHNRRRKNKHGNFSIVKNTRKRG